MRDSQHYLDNKQKKRKAAKIIIVIMFVALLLLATLITIFFGKKRDAVLVLVYDRDLSDYKEKLFYCNTDVTNLIGDLQSEIKISYSQTRKCGEDATAIGESCFHAQCKIRSEMENCVNVCQNEAYINLHCVDEDNRLDSLRKKLYSTVQKNCIEQ